GVRRNHSHSDATRPTAATATMNGKARWVRPLSGSASLSARLTRAAIRLATASATSRPYPPGRSAGPGAGGGATRAGGGGGREGGAVGAVGKGFAAARADHPARGVGAWYLGVTKRTRQQFRTHDPLAFRGRGSPVVIVGARARGVHRSRGRQLSRLPVRASN